MRFYRQWSQRVVKWARKKRGAHSSKKSISKPTLKPVEEVQPPERVRSALGKPVRAWLTKNKNGLLIRIGGNVFGDVYLGRITMPNGKIHRVAIKMFKSPLNDWEAHDYQNVIDHLYHAGVQIPKMGMIRIEGKWAQVSQLFGNSKGSKIINKLTDDWKKQPFQNKKWAIIEWAKVANSGLLPAIDMIEPFKNKKMGIIPIDIDCYVITGLVSEQKSGKRLSEFISHISSNAEQRNAFIDLAKKLVKQEILPYIN